MASTRGTRPGPPARSRTRAAERKPIARGYDARAATCLLLASLVLLGAVVATLSHTAHRRTGSNGALAIQGLGSGVGGGTFCQPGERVPAGTGSISASMRAESGSGPALLATLSRAGHVLQRVPVAAGWSGSRLTVPLQPTTRTLDGVKVCFVVEPGAPISLVGWYQPSYAGGVTYNGRKIPDRSIAIDYRRPQSQSGWSFAGTVARRLGRGRGGWGGPWVAWAIVALVLAGLAVAGTVLVRTVLSTREPATPGRVPAAALAIALVAVLNAAAWSLITPAFQVPDESTHFAYAQQIAETGRPPVKRKQPVPSPEQVAVTRDLRMGGIGLWSSADERRLERDLGRPLSRRGNGDAEDSRTEPPLYYALEALPYLAGSGGTVLSRLALMRLLSALMAGVTALFVYLFVRECLPGRPWAWSVGALGAAFAPMFGFMSGGVNPDALLYADCAALFYLLACAFRRGMTTRLAIWLGVALAIGLIGKINFYGLVPGAVVAIVLAARRPADDDRPWYLIAIALGVGLAPFVLVRALDVLAWDRGAILEHSAATVRVSRGGAEGGTFSYLWQFYLPRLPGQATVFPGQYVGYDLWFRTFIGKFGLLAIPFPAVVYRIALALVAAIVGGAIGAAVRMRGELRERRPELLGYALMGAGLLLLIDLVELRGWAPGVGGAAQGRYLLPMLALFAGVIALAARSAGERWGRAAGVTLVVIAAGWSLFGQLVTIASFYV